MLSNAKALTALAALVLIAACSAPKPPPKAPTQPAATEPAADQTQEQGTAEGAPKHMPIGQLAPDAEKEVRIAGRVSRVLGMRLVPPKVIFEVSDDSGTVKVVVNEKARFNEGQKVEIVGHYKAAPDPMYTGPGEAPEAPILVVDRFIAF